MRCGPQNRAPSSTAPEKPLASFGAVKRLWVRLDSWLRSKSVVQSRSGEGFETVPCPICGRDVRVRRYGYGGKFGPLWVYPGTRAMRLMCEEQHSDARVDHARARRGGRGA